MAADISYKFIENLIARLRSISIGTSNPIFEGPTYQLQNLSDLDCPPAYNYLIVTFTEIGQLTVKVILFYILENTSKEISVALILPIDVARTLWRNLVTLEFEPHHV
jgi:hypothetical protein